MRDAGAWRWRVNWRVIQRDLAQLTGFDGLGPDWKIDTRSLFIRGGLSAYVDDAAMRVIERHFTDARIDTLAGAGHWLHSEQPRAFLDKVIDFLAHAG